MTTHRLKIWPQYFWAVYTGVKTFEIRYNDRGFQAMDTLELIYYDPSTDSINENRRILATVMGVWTLPDNNVGMSIRVDYREKDNYD